jgi:methylated-DNA-protein-cysteine methyltransferase-like protein
MGDDFARTVARIVRGIPAGRVMSYGEVAIRAGKPGGARAVVRALHADGKIPWWRVVRADRTLAEAVAVEQARRLRAEGVAVTGRRIESRIGGARARTSGADPRAGRSLGARRGGARGPRSRSR